MQVAGEAVARNAIQEVVKELLPPGALVSQQVEVGRDSAAIRLISTRSVSNDKIQKAEREIERRCARKVVLSVASIASQSELAELMQRFSTPAQPAPVAPESLQDIHHDVITRVQPALAGIWPAEAPLQDFDLEFNSTGMVLTVLYKSDHELGKISEDILTRELQEKLGAPAISLVAQRVREPRKRARKAKREPSQPGSPPGI
jgi:hypothetical protein